MARREQRRQKRGKGKVKQGGNKVKSRRKGRGAQSTIAETNFTIFCWLACEQIKYSEFSWEQLFFTMFQPCSKILAVQKWPRTAQNSKLAILGYSGYQEFEDMAKLLQEFVNQLCQSVSSNFWKVSLLQGYKIPQNQLFWDVLLHFFIPQILKWGQNTLKVCNSTRTIHFEPISAIF